MPPTVRRSRPLLEDLALHHLAGDYWSVVGMRRLLTLIVGAAAVLGIAAAGGRSAIPPAAPAAPVVPDLAAAEWPRLWGPHRDARVEGPLRIDAGTRLAEVWRRPLGRGASEVAVTGGRGYATYSDGATDYLLAFDLGSGKQIWQARLAASHQGHGGEEDGPLSTPVVSAGRIFVLDPFG